jgi:DNA repair protein RadA/Sms
VEEAAPRRTEAQGEAAEPVPVSEVSPEGLGDVREETGIGELDRVLGGGLVRGAAVLLGGDPGIGKSTLLMQAMDRLARRGGKALYVSGEESPRQARLRGERLGALSPGLLVLAETDAQRVVATAEKTRPAVLAVDSVQTLFLPDLQSAPGSIAQVREVSALLTAYAKRSETPVFLVGHVTKDGAIAGPRVMEHLVDTVLYFEGDRGHPYRLLRAHKNRFGSVSEVGVFEMKEDGLHEVKDPSALFLSERPAGAPGSAVCASLGGTRPLLVEVQALVAPGAARRTAVGVDRDRVGLLAAVLEKKEGMELAGCDVFVNVAGGMELSEPAADLALVAAMVSSFWNKPIEERTVLCGEVGLAGEVRAVQGVEARLSEAAKMGFARALVPAANLSRAGKAGLEVVGVRSLAEALERVF